MKIRVKRRINEAKKRPSFDEIYRLMLNWDDNEFFDLMDQWVEDYRPKFHLSPEKQEEHFQDAYGKHAVKIREQWLNERGWSLDEFNKLIRQAGDDMERDIAASQKIPSPGYLSWNDPSVKAVYDQYDDGWDDEPEYKESAGIKSWTVITIPKWVLETWEQNDQGEPAPWSIQQRFVGNLNRYLEMVRLGKDVPNLQDDEKAAIERDRKKLQRFGKIFWLSLPGDSGRQLPIQRAGGGVYNGGSKAAVLLHIDPERIERNPRQKDPRKSAMDSPEKIDVREHLYIGLWSKIDHDKFKFLGEKQPEGRRRMVYWYQYTPSRDEWDQFWRFGGNLDSRGLAKLAMNSRNMTARIWKAQTKHPFPDQEKGDVADYKNIFEGWRQNTLDEAREDDLRKKYGPRFFLLKRFTGASELMDSMIDWANRTDYNEFRRREQMFASQRRMGDISTEEYMQRVNDLRGDNRPTHRKVRLKYLDWMIKQIEIFANRVELLDAEGNHSTLQKLERLADKESAELSGNAIRRYVPDYIKNPGPNIKAYKSALRTVSTFRNGLKDMVEDFEQNKRAMKEKDINRYEHMGALRKALKTDVYEPRIDKSIAGYETRVPKSDARFFDLPRPFTMVRPLTTKASCAYGSGKWCIAQKGNEHFDNYTNANDFVFYIVQDHSRRKEDKFSIINFQVDKDVDWDDNYHDWNVEGYWDYPNNFHSNFGRLRFEYGNEIVDSMLKIIDNDMENFSGEKKDDEEKNADMEPGAPRQIDWDDDDDYDIQGPRFQNAGEQYADDRAMRGGDWYSDDEEPVRESKKLKLSIKVKIAEKKKKPCKKAKGKRYVKRVNGKCRSYGQAGKAKGGGDRIRPGTKKGDAYCARSAKIKKCKNPPCANDLSRKKWKCRGSKSMKSE